MNPEPTWRKSSRCANGNCVEVAGGDQGAMMRDGKLDHSPVLTFGASGWRQFLDGIRDGEFDRQ